MNGYIFVGAFVIAFIGMLWLTIGPIATLIILGLIIWGIHKFFSSGGKKEEGVSTAIELDADTERAIGQILSFTNAAQQIARASKCSASPVNVQLREIQGPYAYLNIFFTIYNVQTNPFRDLEYAVSLSFGSVEPKFVDRNILLLNPLEATEEKRIEKQKEIEKICYQAIYQELFGEEKSYFDGIIDQYFLEISDYPIGNVIVSFPSANFPSKCYQGNFSYLKNFLRKKYPEASIDGSSSNISIAF